MEQLLEQIFMSKIHAKGNYYRLKTKKWFQDLGYYCEYLEKRQRIITKTGRVINIARDVAGADGIAMNLDQMIFWQCKLNKSNVAAAVKEFNKYPYPSSVDRWIIIWVPRAREPEVVPV